MGDASASASESATDRGGEGTTDSVAGTEGARGRAMVRKFGVVRVRAREVRVRVRVMVRVSVRVRVKAIGIRDIKGGKARKQMCLQKRGGWQKGSVAARAPSTVRGNTVLLFSMITLTEGGGVLCW